MKKLWTEEKLQKLRDLERVLKREIKGQDHMLGTVIPSLQRGELGLTKPGRPRGSFLFLGPTGVGKTETALVFTEHLWGKEKLFRLDMSEFQNQESVGLLLGGRPGEKGFLGAVLEKAIEGTLLLDEIEKAHPRIMDLFLQLLDAARLTVATGETLDFSGFYVVMTSNIGASEILNLQHSSESTLERHVLARAQQALRPEIYARIGEKLVFHRLTYEHQLEIAEKFLKAEVEFLKSKGIEIEVGEDLLPLLVREGFDSKLGARPLRQVIERQLSQMALSEALNLPGGGCQNKVSVPEVSCVSSFCRIFARGCRGHVFVISMLLMYMCFFTLSTA